MNKLGFLYKKVSVPTAILTYLGIVMLAMVLPLVSKWKTHGGGYVLAMAPFFPLGLAKHFAKSLADWVSEVLAYGIYTSMFALFVMLRQRYIFVVLVLVLCLILCLNMSGCEDILQELHYS